MYTALLRTSFTFVCIGIMRKRSSTKVKTRPNRYARS